MDKIDHKIIGILRQDAELTNAALAEQVNLSPSSCLRRVQKLKQQGIIRKMICVIDDKALGRNLQAIVEVDLDRHGHASFVAFQEKVKNEDAIIKAFGITGDSDVVLFLNLTDMDEYQDLCDRFFDRDKNIIRFRTSFVMRQIKD